jgi:5-methylthioribose kinase
MELDIENFDALRCYMAEHAGQGEPVSFNKLPGGVSNRVVKVTWADGRSWVVKQALAKLRVTVDWFSNPDRILVEARALRWLNRLAPPGTTPSFTFEDAPNHLMAMEAIPVDHENWKSVLLSGRIILDQFEQFGYLLGTIHRKSADSAQDVSKAFGDTSYFESLRLGPYYYYAAQQSPAAAGFLKALAEETLHHKLSLVHGDFSPKNTLVYRGKLILLDYEVVHFGDPTFDVGFSLTHFLSKAHHLRRHRATLANAAGVFWRAYFKEIAPLDWTGTEPRIVRHTLGCLLARVIGKSPLEYLTADEATRQRDATLQLIANPPTTIDHLIAAFIQKIEAHAQD